MSDTADDSLPEAAEALLSDWPVPERSDTDWDRMADAVEARLADAGETPGDLLTPPLPKLAEEGAALEDDDDAEEVLPEPMDDDGESLADLARSFGSAAGERSSDDDVRASLALSARSRDSVPELARRSAPPASVPPAAASASVPPPSSESNVVPLSAAPGAARSDGGSNKGVVVGGVLALLGAAAAVAIVMLSGGDPQTEPSAAAPLPAASGAVAEKAKDESATDRKDDAVSLDDLPAESKGGDSDRAVAAAPKAAPVAGKPPGEEEPAEAEEKAEEEQPDEEKIVLAEEPEDDLGKGAQPAAERGLLPREPSSGAVHAAIGSVMGAARACVAGQEAAVRATVTFGSSGRVQSVSVSGPAAGCIRGALSRARVAPFAKSSFSVGVTVRP